MERGLAQVSRSTIPATLLGFALSVACASVALAHGSMGGGGLLSGDSIFVPFGSAFLVGALGYGLMVWEPGTGRDK